MIRVAGMRARGRDAADRSAIRRRDCFISKGQPNAIEVTQDGDGDERLIIWLVDLMSRPDVPPDQHREISSSHVGDVSEGHLTLVDDGIDGGIVFQSNIETDVLIQSSKLEHCGSRLNNLHPLPLSVYRQRFPAKSSDRRTAPPFQPCLTL
jgi:hypothetical protein